MGNVPDAYMFDLGAMYCAPWFALGELAYGLFSAGLALENLSAPLEFAPAKTHLPHTFRVVWL
ncbi:MAG: hypothetical protein ACUVTG_08385 [Candidatus Oleimicrobiaceae bacterium]